MGKSKRRSDRSLHSRFRNVRPFGRSVVYRSKQTTDVQPLHTQHRLLAPKPWRPPHQVSLQPKPAPVSSVAPRYIRTTNNHGPRTLAYQEHSLAQSRKPHEVSMDGLALKRSRVARQCFHHSCQGYSRSAMRVFMRLGSRRSK